MFTKTIDKIKIKEDPFIKILNHLNKLFKEKKGLNKSWIKIKNKSMYVIPAWKILIKDFTRSICSRTALPKTFYEYPCRAMSLQEAYELFYEKADSNPLLRGKKKDYSEKIACKGPKGDMYLESNSGFSTLCHLNDDMSLNIPVIDIKNIGITKNIADNLKKIGIADLLIQCICMHIIPEGLPEDEIEIMEDLINIPNKELNSKLDSLFNSNSLYELLLNCDKIRADIEPYDAKRLEDPNLGHWDLWSEKSEGDNYETIKLEKKLVARNPIADIKEDGIIGIDFGTKSTVVTCQDGYDYTQPMRIGMGKFSKKIEPKHFENPTVMEFIDLTSFLNDYKQKNGRPETKWEDLTVSHTANNSLLSSMSDDFYSFFNELKQWCGESDRQIRIRDKKDNEHILPFYKELSDTDWDPVEIYSYYLGLYINNMHNGIFMDYLLSFPVTYEKKVREAIVKSFEKGLKKSLPETILENPECMKSFRVRQGTSEPAAYAICALEQYGFEPEGEEKVFYGVFDFGGGTTDYDFGIWREATEKESRYDFIIDHFGSEGDRYLGGENLLELLAYEVFKNNQDQMRQEKISIRKPADCQPFAGSEILLNDSQEAKLNTKQLMESLRPLWENSEGSESTYKDNSIKVNLFDNSGEPKMNFELKIDVEELKQILRDRIGQGVRGFFEAFKLTFKNDSENMRDIKKMNIFLAGNSSKSEIVRELFDKYMLEYTEKIRQEEGQRQKKSKQDGDEENAYFELFPPLGTEEAFEIQKTRGIEVDPEDITIPTGKTGVAYGLLEGRPGGVIKVISEEEADEEIKFKFYIGRNRRKKFKPVLMRDAKYNEWHPFISADSNDFELFYTSLPQATTNKLSIQETKKKKGRVETADAEATIYIRVVSPDQLEYVVAKEGEIEDEKYLCNIQTMQLSL